MTLTAAIGSVTKVVTVTVAPPVISSVALSPTSVRGGITTTLNRVNLNAAAPAAGMTVTLTSSNALAGGVPTSVTVAGGQTFATFPITTAVVAANTPVVITGAASGRTAVATLTVTP